VLNSAREPSEVVAALRSFPGEVGALACGYVDQVAYRPVNGEDVGEPSVQQLSELIVGASGRRWNIPTHHWRTTSSAGTLRCATRYRPAPRRLRRPPRRGSDDLPAPRRAWHLRRPLGDRDRAACNLVGRPQTCGYWAAHRSGPSCRGELRGAPDLLVPSSVFARSWRILSMRTNCQVLYDASRAQAEHDRG